MPNATIGGQGWVAGRVWVAAREHVESLVATGLFGSVISIESPFTRDSAPRLGWPVAQVVLSMLDTDDEEVFAPSYDQVGTALLMGRDHAQFGCDRGLLVHCHQGRSRSAAVAIAILADRLGARRVADAVDWVVEQRVGCVPNALIIRHADEWLGFGGRLVEAVRSHPDVCRSAPDFRRERRRWLDGWRQQFSSGGVPA